jgi:galactose-1-phosphate uridylyltransferase
MICRGQTTSILDIALLEEGFTFINENLYPMLYPLHETAGGPGTDGAALGLHFLQWTSSYHNKDWPELSSRDRLIVLSRLAALEERLLTLPNFPLQKGERSHVSIIKNVGLRVGGSLSHGHQQIGLSNVLPRRVKEHQDFVKNTGLTFSEHMIRENPACLTVSNLSEGKLFVPYYMRRPYDLLFCVTDTKAGRLSTLSQRALSDIGEALALGSTLMTKALLLLEREIAYNVIFHTGPGTGIYLEFLPHTQENGGFEQMGMNVCQESPFTAARVLREFL